MDPITVIQEDIDKANQCREISISAERPPNYPPRAKWCPLSQCLIRLGKKDVRVGCLDVDFNGHTYLLTKEAKDFISRWDWLSFAEPLTLVLTEDKEITE